MVSNDVVAARTTGGIGVGTAGNSCSQMVEKSNGITEVEAAVAAQSDVVSNDVVAARAAGGIGVSTAGIQLVIHVAAIRWLRSQMV